MKKILTVEDDREINRLICEYLSSQGYETLSADGRRQQTGAVCCEAVM